MKKVSQPGRLRSAIYYYGGYRLQVRYHRSATETQACVSISETVAPNAWISPRSVTLACSVEEAAKIRKQFLEGRIALDGASLRKGVLFA